MFLAELLTTQSICSAEKNFETKGFFPKKYVWLSFLILNEEIPDLWQKFSTRVSKTKSTWPEEFFGRTLFAERYNLMSFDGFSEEKLICKKTQCSSVRHSSCPVEHSKGQISWRNKTFRTLGTERESFGFLFKKFGKIAKTTFHVTRATFGLNSTFFKKKLHF